jgi:hypothetical protein
MPYDGQSNADRVHVLKSFAGDFAEPRQLVLLWTREDQDVPNDAIKIWMPTPWDNRGWQVTLAGDAAHAISFRMSHSMVLSQVPKGLC